MLGARHSRTLSRGALLAVLVSGAALLAPAVGAETPAPAANPDISLSAQPMLGGVFAPSGWIAVRVDVQNSGPAVRGELRLAPSTGQGSIYSLPVELASGARQEHFLYTRAGPFGTRFDVSLRSGSDIQATARVAIDASQNESRRVYVVAEHPERLTQPLGAGLAAKGTSGAKIVAITPEDLPPRVEAWSSVDMLVWHDIDSSRLGTEREAALKTWLATGGNLLILGGSSGTTTFGGFPADVLPYQPEAVIDVAPADLATYFGQLPPTATAAPALTGPLTGGTVLWQTADGHVIGARSLDGQGSVVLAGLDPAAEWLAGTDAAAALWLSVVPGRGSWDDTQLPADDSFIVNALGQLPAVQLPGSDMLLVLILAYVVAIGPVNYVVLRRRDRREWAWLTMPLTIGLFGLIAYGIGVGLKGSSVIVSELAIVEAGLGAQQGQADVHVGIFSPGRSDLNVRVGQQAMVSAPSNMEGTSQQRPLDVLIGDPATVRNFGVNFGAMRSFRAQTTVDVPLLQADLKVTAGKLEGTVTNASSSTLHDVSVVFGPGGRVLGDAAPGESRQVSLAPASGSNFEPLSWSLYPDSSGTASATGRTLEARRAIIDHLAGGWDNGFGGPATGIFDETPMILAWASGPSLDVDVGAGVERVGETAYLWPARVSIAGPVVFQGALLGTTVVSTDAVDGGNGKGNAFFLSRGTIVADYHPVDFDGTFTVGKLGLRLGVESVGVPAVDGTDLAPLPADEQPDPDAPLASNPRPEAGEADMPRLQLLDRQSGTWVEFEPARSNVSYDIPDAVRYVDTSGSFRVRFVVRSSDYVQFNLAARVEGVVQ